MYQEHNNDCCCCVSEQISGITSGAIQDLIPRTTSLIFPNQGVSEEQTKIDLIFPILVKAKMQSPGLDGFTYHIMNNKLVIVTAQDDQP